MSLLEHAPSFNHEQAAKIAQEVFGVECTTEWLPSERDQNFLLTENAAKKFVLKIANSLEQRSLLEAQNRAMTHLAERVSFCSHVVAAKSGEAIVEIESEDAIPHFVRLVTYIPGIPLAEATLSSSLLFDVGSKLGSITRCLSDFDHPAVHRSFHWDLANGVKTCDEYNALISDVALRNRINAFVSEFRTSMSCRMATLPCSVIHGDANDYNIIVEDDRMVGLIDFGDMIYSSTVGELAVAMAYAVLGQPDPLTTAKQLLAGYVSEWMLSRQELDVLWSLMLMRLCMSVCLAAHQQRQKPSNKYLNISQTSIGKSLPRLLEIDSMHVAAGFRNVASLR